MQAQPGKAQSFEIEGLVDVVRGPYGAQGNWFIVDLKNVSQENTATHTETIRKIVGCLPPNIEKGATFRFQGVPVNNPKYGWQLKATTAVEVMPRNQNGIAAYLARHFSGVGEKISRRMIEKFGEQLFDVMDKTPEKLSEVHGISEKKAETLAETWQAIKHRKKIDKFFAENRISNLMIRNLMKAYGLEPGEEKKLIAQIKENPYKLIDHVKGVGFHRADEIAHSMGISGDNLFRLNAGLLHTLKEAAKSGHTFMPKYQFGTECEKLLKTGDSKKIREAINLASYNGQIVDDTLGYYLKDLHEAEKSAAGDVLRLIDAPRLDILNHATESDVEGLDQSQRKALELMLEAKVIVITGGPGVGKTHTVKTIIRALGRERKILLAAPTGKAAKRMEEATAKEAMTIHRLLRYSPMQEGFVFNRDNPLDVDTLIIDESSMMDIRLFASLMEALPDFTQIILVGDKDQLPSVGPGRVFADLIESKVVPVAMLTELHRQEAGGGIDLLAKQINAGETPTANSSGFTMINGKADTVFHCIEASENIPGMIEKYTRGIIGNMDNDFGFEDVQILCPQKIGKVGAREMNTMLRDKVFNPYGEKVKGTFFREGDRVIQTRNNYEIGIFNGEIGIIVKDYGDFVLIEFENGSKGMKSIEYPKEDFKDLDGAYALTIHKSQGSEFPVVIMPVHTTNWIMLKRQLVYTGATRGKKLLVVIGNLQGLDTAVRTEDGVTRNSGLARRLAERV